MNCKICNTKMHLDDTDKDFNGFYDNYWVCPKCNTEAIEKVREDNTEEVKYYNEKLDYEFTQTEDFED